MKLALIFLLRWSNALLFLLHTVDFIRQVSSIGRVLGLKCLAPSLGGVAALAAFLAAKKLNNLARCSFAFWANLIALGFYLYWTFHWLNGDFGKIEAKNVAPAWIFLGLILLVPAINLVFFWHTSKGSAAGSADDLALPVTDETRNFFTRHWRGHLPLAVSFWLCSWMAALLFFALRMILDGGYIVRDLRTAAILYGVIYLIAFILGIWVFVGVWRSATRHVVSGKRPAWGSLAKLTLILLVLNQIGMAIWIYQPRVREHLDFIAGHELVEPYQIMSSGGGEVVELRGGLRYGSANDLQMVLARLPGAKVLKVNSPGGRISEGLKMVNLVRQRKLDTYASQRCMSAATLVLSAAKARGAEAGTKVGFHASRNPSGGTGAGDALVMESMLSAGVSEDFVHRVLSVPSERMWYPSPEEMLKARVLTSYGVFPPIAPVAPSANRTPLNP